MIVVTGAAGFIGSCMIARLNEDGFSDVLAVDEFSSEKKLKNLSHKQLQGVVHRNMFLTWLDKNHRKVDHIFHLGARTDTVEQDIEIFNLLNLHYSQSVWQAASQYQIPLTYASSAATYGDGTLGYGDSHQIIDDLKPLNPYGCSKNDFDKWVLQQQDSPPSWTGLKFFNVYGPVEEAKKALDSQDTAALDSAQKSVEAALHGVAEKLYQTGDAQAAEAADQAAAGSSDEDVIDAEYTEEKGDS